MIEIEQLLRLRIGLDSASVGPTAIQRTIRLRMKALGITDERKYLELICKPGPEWNELVESSVVTETWFFRDREPFDAFVRFVRETGIIASGVRLRILSVPCSSGEEPYSLAIALLEAGLPLDRFHVDAADISARALARAKRAVYGKNSFRGDDLAFRDRYFQQSKEGYVLDSAVRSSVHFSEGNLLNPSFLNGKGTYDFIFCRNLLIYFDRETQLQALRTLYRLLAPSGVLMVGAAEQSIALDNGFTSANTPMAFACRKNSTSRAIPIRQSRTAKAFTLGTATMPVNQTIPKSMVSISGGHASRHDRKTIEPVSEAGPAVTGKTAFRQFKVSPQPNSDLEAARRLADAGQLEDAALICETHLRTHSTSAQAWYLLGLVRDATGDPVACECYRKALYLDPNHYETLLQMAWWAEQKGENARALGFKNRASRIKTAAILNRDSASV